MPGALIERSKMTRAMYQALKRHIMREREKKKQEQEQDEALKRMKQEREQQKKKAEEDSLTLEQTKEQIQQLEIKVEKLKQEKHELFSQLKKVLHQEDETKKKAQQREQNELLTLQQHQPQSYQAGGLPVPGHPMFSGMMRQTSKYLNPMPPQTLVPGMKRRRSPSPPPNQPQIYPSYSASNAKYPNTSYTSTAKQEPYTPRQKPPNNYPGQTTHVTFVNQSRHSYPQPQQPPTTYPGQTQPPPTNSGKFPPAAGQSAFTSYPNHYAHQQKQIPEHFPPGYPVPQGQPGDQKMSVPVGRRAPAGKNAEPAIYVKVPSTLGSSEGAYTPHMREYTAALDLNAQSNLPLQQQLEHANQKSGFSEEKFKLQQQQQHQQQIRNVAQLAPAQQVQVMQGQRPPLPQHAAPPPASVASQPKGSIVTGYPVRTQAGGGSYQPNPQGSHASPPGVPRHPYQGQQPPQSRSYY